jgi:hypothetical protein
MSYSSQILSYMEQHLALADDEQQMDFIVLALRNVPAEQHEAVMQECATYLSLRQSVRRMDGVSWADVWAAEDEAKDARYVRMSLNDWEIAKANAKRCGLFSSWSAWQEWAHRINVKRRPAPTMVIAREPDRIAQLLSDRSDVMRYPAQHVTNEAEKIERIREIESSILRLGGKERLQKVTDAEW